MRDIYDKADQAIREMNRRNQRAFGSLKLARWDELNVIRQVGTVYDESTRLAVKKYREVAWWAYVRAMTEAKVSAAKAKQNAYDFVDLAWVMEILTDVDPVTLYAFIPERDRKKQRLIEALTAAQNKNAEIDKALRYWTMQVGQYAVNVTDRARLDAFRNAGVKKVMWHTRKDERVCNDCGPMDGMIFDIDKVPDKPHINCRCFCTVVWT